MARKSTRPVVITCEVCRADVPVKPAGRIPQYCLPCREMNNAMIRVETTMEAWMTSMEVRAASEGRALNAAEQRAATGMRSRLMSASNLPNKLGRPRRIRSNRERASWWNSRDGAAAAAALKSK